MLLHLHFPTETCLWLPTENHHLTPGGADFDLSCQNRNASCHAEGHSLTKSTDLHHLQIAEKSSSLHLNLKILSMKITNQCQGTILQGPTLVLYSFEICCRSTCKIEKHTPPVVRRAVCHVRTVYGEWVEPRLSADDDNGRFGWSLPGSSLTIS